jgi:esterase/lipase superfamily enzyme
MTTGDDIDVRKARGGRGRFPRIVAALSLALGLAACASAPDGLLVPGPTTAGAGRIDMLAATTRAVAENPAQLFSGERGDAVSFANIVVSVPPDREIGSLQRPRSPPGDPRRDFTVTAVAPLDEAQTKAWFKTSVGKSRRVFVFVHGFNTSFERAVFRFAQLAYDTDAAAAPVLFSWPSRGRLLDYKRDSDNASYSRSDLARLLDIAAASPNVSEITVLAHSLGSWVAVEAIRHLALQHNGTPPKIKNLILAAPDLDVGVFRRQVEDMGPRRPQITLFVAQTDRALQLSRFLTRGMTRLGAIDPSREDYMRQIGGLSGVTVLDLTALQSNDRINHDLFAQSPAVVRLIGDRLIQGQDIGSKDVDGFAPVEALGSAAGLVVSAPILVLQAAGPK